MTTSRIFRPLIGLLSLLLALSGAMVAGTVSDDLKSLPPNQVVRAIIRYSSKTKPANMAAGVTKIDDIADDADLVQMTVNTAKTVAQSSNVTIVTPNREVHGTATTYLYDYTPETILNQIQSSKTPNFRYGRDVGVAIIDSGIHVNADLMGNDSNGNGGK